MRSALGGSPEAADQLAVRLRRVPRTMRVLNRRRGELLSAHDLEDLAQDALLRIWAKLPSYSGHAGLDLWLQKFCYLEYMNRIRSKGRRGEYRTPEDPDVLPARASTAFTVDDYARLDGALEELGPPDADVIRLKHFERLSFTEVGAALGISPNTAKSRYYRGLTWLQRELRARLEDVV